MKSSRDVGLELEVFVKEELEMDFTVNSGAALDDADLKDNNIIIECKNNPDKKSVTIPANLIDKVKKQANKWHRWDWAIVNRTKLGTFATIPFSFFTDLYNAFKALQKM